MPSTLPVAELRESHRGPVIASQDPGYERARETFNALVDRRPVVVARAVDVGDVSAAVRFARANHNIPPAPS
jgi:hypothetical protein